MKEQQSSQVCLVAKKIYQVWKEKGQEGLQDFFQTELMIPEAESCLFAQKYNPTKPPSDVCPLEAFTQSWRSSKIFEQLSLQLPSVHDQDGVWPKNLLAWWVLRSIYGADVFDFQIDGTGKMGDNRISFPARFADDKGAFVPFGLAAIEAVEFENVPAHVARKSTRLQKTLGRECGLAFAQALLKADFIFPPDKTVDQLVAAIQRGLSGEEVVLTGAFCPDYAYETTDDPLIPYRYTFDNIGTGIGLVAQQFQRVLPHLVEFFNQFGIRYRIILAIGDFEANSQDILDRVKLTRDEFVARCLVSLSAFRQSLPDIPMELRLFEQDWANGRWNRYCAESYAQMSAGDYGQIQANTGKNPYTEVVRFTARASKKFYQDWYGREMSEAELMDIVIRQGAEYAAMGRVLSEDLVGQPFIQVAGDRAKMQAFLAMHSDHPAICTKRVY